MARFPVLTQQALQCPLGSRPASASLASAACSHFYAPLREGQGIIEGQSGRPGSFSSPSLLKHFKGRSISVRVPCLASLTRAVTHVGLRLHRPGLSALPTTEPVPFSPTDTWGPGLALPLYTPALLHDNQGPSGALGCRTWPQLGFIPSYFCPSASLKTPGFLPPGPEE